MTWHSLDLGRELPSPEARAEVLIHLAPLWLLPRVLGIFAAGGLKRLVAFGSTSRFSKAA